MADLTPKQQRVFDYIRDTLARQHVPPTRAEIAAALGFSSANAAQTHLRVLERKGVLTLDANRSRSIRLVDEPPLTQRQSGKPGAARALAVVGRVAAGAPMLAVEHLERHCMIDPALFSQPADYLLRVRGDSMMDAGILDGDLLGVRVGTDVRQGQIAVFRWDDEVTVKRFYQQGHEVRLVAANPVFDDMVIDTRRESLTMEGLAVGVIRAL